MKQVLACLWGSIFIALLISPAKGQVLRSQTSSRLTTLQPTQVQLEQASRMTELLSMAGLLALEGAFDPDKYILGPGDLFTITLGGADTRQFFCTGFFVRDSFASRSPTNPGSRPYTH